MPSSQHRLHKAERTLAAQVRGVPPKERFDPRRLTPEQAIRLDQLLDATPFVPGTRLRDYSKSSYDDLEELQKLFEAMNRGFRGAGCARNPKRRI